MRSTFQPVLLLNIHILFAVYFYTSIMWSFSLPREAIATKFRVRGLWKGDNKRQQFTVVRSLRVAMCYHIIQTDGILTHLTQYSVQSLMDTNYYTNCTRHPPRERNVLGWTPRSGSTFHQIPFFSVAIRLRFPVSPQLFFYDMRTNLPLSSLSNIYA